MVPPVFTGMCSRSSAMVLRLTPTLRHGWNPGSRDRFSESEALIRSARPIRIFSRRSTPRLGIEADG